MSHSDRRFWLNIFYSTKRLILPGSDWAQEIDAHLETASVILLLVSADFLASDYCYSIEMKRALERHAAGEARVVPILTRPVDWKGTPFAHLRALPTDAKPITSWQNKDRALADVAAGIRRVIEDGFLLATSTLRAALPPIWNIPYPRNPFFLGRETELVLVRHHLLAGQATSLSQPLAISGMGGIGKTQLALEYAYCYARDYQAVLWAHAESTETLIASYIALATLLQLPQSKAKEQTVVVQAVMIWLQTHQGWLLILDNADELTLVRNFLPPTLGGHLLLTTRAQALGRLASRIEVETFSAEQGALLLLRRAGLLARDALLQQTTLSDREMAMQIAQALGGLPLALDQAGAYLEETGIDLIGYWNIYEQHRADLLRERGGLVADHPASVATTWLLSFEKVREKSAAASELLQMLAFLSPDAIAEEILTASPSKLGPVLAPVAENAFLLNQAIEVLRAYSLVRRDPKGRTLSIHRLVQATLQDALEEHEKRLWAERILFAIYTIFPSVEYGILVQCERLLPQVFMVAQLIEKFNIINDEAGNLLYKTASYLRGSVRYPEAELLLRQALHIHECYWGGEHPIVAYSLAGWAILNLNRGKFAEAEPLYQSALRIREHYCEPDHLEVAYSLNGLADLYRNQGKYGEAELLYQRALQIGERHGKGGHRLTAYSLNGLGILYYEQRIYPEAEIFFQRAVSMRELYGGSEHPDVADSICGLATVYCKQEKYAEAEQLLQRAIHIQIQHLHPRLAASFNSLANIYRNQGKYIQAEPLYLQALDIHGQVLGSEHPERGQILDDLANFWDVQGNDKEAMGCYARALAVRLQVFGAHHLKTTETRLHFIALLRRMGQHEEAAKLEEIQSEP